MTKLAQMNEATADEPAGDQPRQERRQLLSPRRPSSLDGCITRVATPQGSLPILKAMSTTACERNCYYCPFRAGRSQMKRISFTPDELASGFDTLQQAGRVNGLFLSSGIIKGGIKSEEHILKTAEIIRQRSHYKGYLHLKIMPGIEYDQLYRLMQLADRVSVNLEAPTQERLNALAPKKDFEHELLSLLYWTEQIRRAHPEEKLARTVTQFVVGAVGDTDHELLSLSSKLYRETGLARAYYSAFHPVVQTPFENLPAVPELREHRLYQASFLLRDYGWGVSELPLSADGNLNLKLDPKRAWAEQHLRESPIEIMTATPEQLLRIPGLGHKAVQTLLHARRQGRISELNHLRKLHIAAPEQAAPFILLDGHRPAVQMSLFD